MKLIKIDSSMEQDEQGCYFEWVATHEIKELDYEEFDCLVTDSDVVKFLLKNIDELENENPFEYYIDEDRYYITLYSGYDDKPLYAIQFREIWRKQA